MTNVGTQMLTHVDRMPWSTWVCTGSDGLTTNKVGEVTGGLRQFPPSITTRSIGSESSLWDMSCFHAGHEATSVQLLSPQLGLPKSISLMLRQSGFRLRVCLVLIRFLSVNSDSAPAYSVIMYCFPVLFLYYTTSGSRPASNPLPPVYSGTMRTANRGTSMDESIPTGKACRCISTTS